MDCAISISLEKTRLFNVASVKVHTHLKEVTIRSILFTLTAVIALSHPSTARDNDLESWYTYWGLGYTNNTYPEELQNDLDELNDLSGVDHIALSLDMFGFYWPRGDRTLVGGIVNGSADVYEATEDLVDVEIGIYNNLYALSAMHFLTHEIG